ncbi:MAG: thioredoxin domain-containing protein [Bacteroidetes bacterium]|nr:MAG: thioredoxin domain-containing protein [Bacteroidota bacterium]
MTIQRTITFRLHLYLFSALFAMLSCTPNNTSSMNHLKNSSSPYLLQHAHQPVDWYPWGEEALQKAVEEDKLIIISVGYSTCHWCHVMAHETFDDDSVAAFMNENFICIKVDREERPDIDQVYMRAVQMMTGQGGWPLNCVALPDGRPIWGGTYFPKDRWVASLSKILEVRKDDPASVIDYASKLQEGMQISSTLVASEDPVPMDTELFHVMRHNWSRRWDTIEGGPNKAPKFPLPNNYQFLLRYGIQFEDSAALNQTKLTLDAMFKGGLYDHVGGGFTRYSTDAQWRIPHFEKMLYDNGQLLELYANAYKVWKDENYEHVMRQTIGFLNREMKAENGLFYSALDADSEGEEGKFYVWTTDEIKSVLGDGFDRFAELTDWNGRAHWEDENHVILIHPKNTPTLPEWTKWMSLLSAKRDERIRPSTDTKLLSAWNALAISGMIESALALQDNNLKSECIELGNLYYTSFIEGNHVWHAYGENGGYIKGFADDYALSIRLFLKLNTISGNEIWLQRAEEITESALNLFGNPDSPLLWYTSSSHEELVAKSQETEDNVIPSANGLMARNLFQLARALGKSEWEERAQAMTELVIPQAESYPESYTEWAQCALDMHGPFREVALVGENGSDLAFEMGATYHPSALILSSDTKSNEPPFESRFIPGETFIYVCEDRRCQLPVRSIEEAQALIPVKIEDQ